MLGNALTMVLETLFDLFVLAVLLRFYAQAFRAPFRNPVGEFVMALTDFVVKPMRRMVPGILGLDLASLLIAWFVEILLLTLLFAIAGSVQMLAFAGFWPMVIVLALVKLLKLSVYLLLGVLIVQAVLSWVQPYHVLQGFFDALTRPFLRPVRRVLPLIGGVDLSPLVVVLILQVILMVPVKWLEGQVPLAIPRLFAAG